MHPSSTLAVAAAAAALSAAGGYALGVTSAGDPPAADPALERATSGQGKVASDLGLLPQLVLPDVVPRRLLHRRTIVVPAPRPAPTFAARPVSRPATATTSPSSHGGEQDDGGGGESD